MPRFLRAVAILAPLLAAGAAPAEEWRTYRNPRFGVAVDYPDSFSVLDRPPENGDGQVFRTPDGRASLTVSGQYNVLGETPREMMESRQEPGTRYTVAQAGPRDYTLSGAKAGRISYVRCRLSDRDRDTVGCFEIAYPAEDARSWDAAVGRLARSLRF